MLHSYIALNFVLILQKKNGKTDTAKRFNAALETTSTKALRIREAWAVHAKSVLVPRTSKEALSLFTEAHLIKSQYTNIRSQAKMKNS